MGRMGRAWQVLHTGGRFDLWPGFTVGVGYPLVPWIGVMALGYAFGPVLRFEPQRRRRIMIMLGTVAVALFGLLRGTNLYGNPTAWEMKSSVLHTVFAILDCGKYPPSLAYLLMTLGPALLGLAWLDRGLPRWLKPSLVFGRVPLFFYLL